ncbi:MAG TPA: hypothetical protein VEB43_21710 [Anaeromyxobacter sp.]|nr:hypothetical protein [Anaeromyxobacter sp.]
MPPTAVLALLLAAPAFRAEGGVPREAEEAAARAWDAAARLLAAEGVRAPPEPRPIRIVPARLSPAEAGRASPGVLAVRPELPAPAREATLRHEVAHQLLLEACPPASGDRLFHEAVALVASGELDAWAAGEERGPYLSLARALEILEHAAGSGAAGAQPSLDLPRARRALARLLAEAPARAGRLPEVLARPLARCEVGATWTPLRPQDLAGEIPAADALVVLSRHSGEVLVAQGAAQAPLPFGSTLKPFLLAGAAGPTPTLRSDPSRTEWRCGRPTPPRMDASAALLLSCNGWFLDWARRAPEVVRLGTWGDALLGLGLSGLPGDAAEAIGVRPSLRIAPVGLAHAYRLLAEARPDLLDVLSRNAREGTLAHLPASDALRGVALKTGTVLDAGARPRLGLVVAVTPDLVVVTVRAGRVPRTFAADVAERLRREATPAAAAARVQVLGLLPADAVEGRCAGAGFVASPAGPRPAPRGFTGIAALARAGPLVCAGGPWLLRYPGLAEARPYAGVLTREPPPEARPPRAPGPPPTPREQRARRGSDLVLRTARLAYAAGVVEAEDARLRGEPRIALARVADRNGLAASERHPGRPPCDTTHCQAFRGTATPRAEDRAALRAPLPPGPWLPFSRGGDEPWRAERPRAEVERALGPGAQGLSFASGKVTYMGLAGDREAPFMEPQSLPCERLRGPLKLPSCPEQAELRGHAWRFTGRGAGHGEGLDVEWAARSGLRAEEILLRAYGPAVR